VLQRASPALPETARSASRIWCEADRARDRARRARGNDEQDSRGAHYRPHAFLAQQPDRFCGREHADFLSCVMNSGFAGAAAIRGGPRCAERGGRSGYFHIHLPFQLGNPPMLRPLALRGQCGRSINSTLRRPGGGTISGMAGAWRLGRYCFRPLPVSSSTSASNNASTAGESWAN
jgi:hypothetical protein